MGCKRSACGYYAWHPKTFDYKVLIPILMITMSGSLPLVLQASFYKCLLKERLQDSFVPFRSYFSPLIFFFPMTHEKGHSKFSVPEFLHRLWLSQIHLTFQSFTYQIPINATGHRSFTTGMHSVFKQNKSMLCCANTQLICQIGTFLGSCLAFRRGGHSNSQGQQDSQCVSKQDFVTLLF